MEGRQGLLPLGALTSRKPTKPSPGPKARTGVHERPRRIPIGRLRATPMIASHALLENKSWPFHTETQAHCDCQSSPTHVTRRLAKRSQTADAKGRSFQPGAKWPSALIMLQYVVSSGCSSCPCKLYIRTARCHSEAFSQAPIAALKETMLVWMPQGSKQTSRTQPAGNNRGHERGFLRELRVVGLGIWLVKK